MPQQEEDRTVKQTQLNEYENGFIAGVFAAWGVGEPTEAEYRVAMELLIEQRRRPADG